MCSWMVSVMGKVWAEVQLGQREQFWRGGLRRWLPQGDYSP